MEAEAREILNAATQEHSALPAHPMDRIRAFVEKHGGFNLELPPRELTNDPPDFSAEAHRQSLAVAASKNAREDQDFITSVSHWNHE